MPIRAFPHHYQLVYISFDISSFSLISYKVFWCKTQGEMVLNARQKGAKCKAKSINIHSNCINKTF